ncbi:MAG: hypothetical protein KF800_02830 [Lysobacter sp.]|nr:hypothetical protein [Lysobacter sp.]
MSTVLWANQLLHGMVVSDESDKYALHRHLPKLDKLAVACGVPALSSICDGTDLRFNLQDLELPDGMTSTHEWMARDGVWVDAPEAVRLLSALLEAVLAKRPRFGLLRNDCDAVLDELREALAFAEEAAARGARFNFSIVM